jgi:hypothetical protein
MPSDSSNGRKYPVTNVLGLFPGPLADRPGREGPADAPLTPIRPAPRFSSFEHVTRVREAHNQLAALRGLS